MRMGIRIGGRIVVPFERTTPFSPSMTRSGTRVPHVQSKNAGPLKDEGTTAGD